MSIKNSNDTNGNQTRHLPNCSAVPQPTALPSAPSVKGGRIKKLCNKELYDLYFLPSSIRVIRGNVDIMGETRN